VVPGIPEQAVIAGNNSTRATAENRRTQDSNQVITSRRAD